MTPALSEHRRVLLDQNMPMGLIAALAPRSVEIASRLGWATLVNGELLTAAEQAGFDVLVAADRNIRYQQNLRGRKLSFVVLSTNLWPTVKLYVDDIARAIDQVTVSGCVTLTLLRRR